MFIKSKSPYLQTRRQQSGVTLIELIVFIVIISVALVGILSVMNVTNKGSADPMQRKQAIAIAESLLEEIEMQPFTFCDPDDPNAATAKSTADCTVVQGLNKTAGESRTGATRFDNVGDYQSYDTTLTGIVDIQGNVIAGLGNFTASVSLSNPNGNPDIIQIDVRVQSAPTDITLTGYRYRYAPRATQ
jgi:MSHA pilin protein MshD